MAEDTEARTSFAWAGRDPESLRCIEVDIEDLAGFDANTLLARWPSKEIAPHLAEVKEKLAEEMARHPTDPIFSYRYFSEIIHRNGTKIPTENIIVVLRRGNGDAPLIVGVVCESCPFLRQLVKLCRELDDEARRLVLRLASAIAAA